MSWTTVLQASRRLLRSVPAAALVLGLGGVASAAPQQGFAVFVNTTEDLPVEANHCLPGQICPLRSAIERIEGISAQGVIRACYDPETTPGGKACPPGREALSVEDAGYDPETGRWTFEFLEGALPYTLSEGGTTIDFSLDVEDWSGPADNRIVVDAGDSGIREAFIVESSNNTLAGFELHGGYALHAIVLRENLFGDGASNNQLGPGLIFSDIEPGVGVLIRDSSSKSNRFIGNWCGIRGDGSQLAPMLEDCFQVGFGSSRNTVGGEEPGERNIFAGSRIGSGVSVSGEAAENEIIGNWFGLDANGNKAALNSGITLRENVRDTRIKGNVLSGLELSGVAVFDISTGTWIDDNRIGASVEEGGDCIGNGNLGISLGNGVRQSLIERNLITCNERGGITVAGASASANTISRNRITANAGRAIDVAQGANNRVRPPRLTSATQQRVVGNAASCKGGIVEIFSDPNTEAAVFEGVAAAEATAGLFIFQVQNPLSFEQVTATCTDGDGNSSGLSDPYEVAEREPTPVPSPTPDATLGPALFSLYIPYLGRSD